MNNEENQTKPVAEESHQSNKVPSKEAIEIAALILANRAMRELKLRKEMNPKSKDHSK
jgi:hypothetical protein